MLVNGNEFMHFFTFCCNFVNDIIAFLSLLGTFHELFCLEEKIYKIFRTHYRQMLSHIRTIPEIILLGPLGTTAKRIPTLCFLVRHPRSTYLHHR